MSADDQLRVTALPWAMMLPFGRRTAVAFTDRDAATAPLVPTAAPRSPADACAAVFPSGPLTTVPLKPRAPAAAPFGPTAMPRSPTDPCAIVVPFGPFHS